LTDDKKAAPDASPPPNGDSITEVEYRRFVQAVTDYAIFMLNPEGIVSTWNAGAQNIKGYTAAEIVGQHFSRFYSEEDRHAGLPQRGLLRARTENRYEAEGWRLRKDGTRFWASVVIDAVRDDEGELVGFAKITRDITERKKSQEALESAREQLFQAQKLEAIGQLTGGVAHDFNNLLAAVLSGVTLVERRSGDDPQLTRVLTTMRQAIARGRDLIQQLLTFARKQPVNPALVDVGKRMNDTFGLLERLLGGNIRVVTDFPPGLWAINVDPSQFDLAVLNVCLNARDAMPEGGILTISARNLPQADLGGGRRRDCVAITVKDSGMGISRQVLPHIFEPFFTTKEVGKGSGLGLSQAYGFAQTSDGAIDVQSEEGRGTTVTFRLPATDGSPSSSVATEAHNAQAHRGNVLLVEDELALADLTSALLEDSGFNVTIAHSANAAMTILKRGTPIDVVFSDVVMPGGTSGVELAAAIRENFPGLPVILTSGFSDAVAQASDRFIELLTKPYDPDQLSVLLTQRIAEARASA
jgi:PAS domain S-box-containing protein